MKYLNVLMYMVIQGNFVFIDAYSMDTSEPTSIRIDDLVNKNTSKKNSGSDPHSVTTMNSEQTVERLEHSDEAIESDDDKLGCYVSLGCCAISIACAIYLAIHFT